MCITAIVGAAIAGVAAASEQAKIARESTERAYEAEENNLQLVYDENDRLQREAHEIYDSEVHDRVRQSNKELGALTVLMAEQGASSASGSALVIDSEYTTGMDIARINTNRNNQQQQLQANKRAGAQGYLNQTTLAYNQGSAAVARANSSAIGSITSAASAYSGRDAAATDHDNTINNLNS